MRRLRLAVEPPDGGAAPAGAGVRQLSGDRQRGEGAQARAARYGIWPVYEALTDEQRQRAARMRVTKCLTVSGMRMLKAVLAGEVVTEPKGNARASPTRC